MGNARALRYACAFAAIAGLSACNPPARQSDIAELRAENVKLRREVALLRDDMAEMNGRLEAVKSFASASAKIALDVGDQVNNNARVANENAIKEMTRRGACGTRLVRLWSDETPPRQIGIRNEVIPCTEKDLRR